MLDCLSFLEHAFRRFLDVLKTLTDALVGERKDRLLGMIQDVLRLVFLLQGLGAYLARHFDELP